MHDNIRDNDDELVFQDLTPEQPANAFQKSIIRLQQNWPPQWIKRHRLLWRTVIAGILIFCVLFAIIYISTQQNRTIYPSQSATTTIGQIVPAANVIYLIVNNVATNTGTLEALNAHTGTLIWSYAHHNAEGIKLFKNILYIQTSTNLVALNATNRTLLWENQTFSDFGTWQTDQNILFTAESNSIITALNAETGRQLWQSYEPFSSWKVEDGIFYAILSQNLGLTVLNAHNGKQLWHDPNIYQNFQTQVMAVDNGNIYLQNYKNSTLQAFVGASGKLLWQINTHGTDFVPVASNGFLFLSAVTEALVEVVHSQTGKLLWQRPGTLTGLTVSANQTAIMSPLKNETDIIRTADGTSLYRFLHPIDQLLPLGNGLAICIKYTNNTQNASFNVEAVRLSNGVTLWSNQVTTIQYLQNGTVALVSDADNTLLLRRDDTGQILWQYKPIIAGS
jgi:outer membrane protein assembly factor BamB